MVKEEETFTFETIAQVYREERSSTTLTKLPLHFFQQLADYLERLRNSYLQERKNDPSSPKTLMLEDEHNKAQKRTSQIYEIRERKIALLALQTANGGKPNLSFMTKEEKNAFKILVDTLIKNRSYILLQKEEDTCVSKPFVVKDQKPSKAEANDENEAIVGTYIQERKKAKEEAKSVIVEVQQENPVLLILEDIPSFETEERTFNLKKDDTITLPKKLAKILCKHGKARVIQG